MGADCKKKFILLSAANAICRVYLLFTVFINCICACWGLHSESWF